MNGSWVKSFTDGTYEYGNDRDIANGEASWSNGRLSDIKQVEITDGSRKCFFQVEGTEWHQFDKFTVVVAPGIQTPTRTHRVVQAKLQPDHIGLKIDLRTTGSLTMCKLTSIEPKVHGAMIAIIDEQDIGSWLSFVLPATGAPYVEIGEKGKIEEKS